MSYIIKTMNGDTPLYFYKLCRKVYQDKATPAFRGAITDAYVFDTQERAYRMMAIISGLGTGLKLELDETPKTSSLRGEDGYVPLEKTVDAMLSDDPALRLWAEYEQLNTRRHKLKEYRKSLDGLSTDPAELEVIDEQIAHMHSYMIDLLTRCEYEGIDLTEVEKTLNQ